MKIGIFLLSFVIFNCLNIESEVNQEIITYNLSIEMNRNNYTLKSNQTYRFINSNEKFIYFIELPKGIISKDENNNTYKDLISLSGINQSIIIISEDYSEEEFEIYVTSILNNVDIIISNSLYSNISNSSDKNIILLVYTDNEGQILSLDSFENSLLFYYYKYDFVKISPKDFYPINKQLFYKYEDNIVHLDNNSVYIIFVELYKFDYTYNMLNLFISPEQVNKNLLIKNNIIFLKQSDNYYNLTFENTNLSRILKLSRKTNDSEVISINGEIILNNNNLYYELPEENIQKGILLKIKNNNCLLEILYSSKNNMEIFDSYSVENYKLTKKYNIIKIPKNKCKYEISILFTNKNNLTTYSFGINNKISKKDYFYNWINLSGLYIDKEYNYKYSLPYLYNTEIGEEEYQIFEIILDDMQLKNDIFLTYNPISYFKYLYKEIDEQKSEYIIGNISSYLKKFYIYKDIAKKPPKIENLENYHHKPIDMLDSLNKISIKNKTHLGLFQDINNILRAVRDEHLDIILTNIEDKINLPSTSFCIPFDFYIETDENDNPKLKMKANFDCLEHYINKNKILNFLEEHENIYIKLINNTEPFEYIQNFGKIQNYKNRHAQFTYNLKIITTSRIDLTPLDLSDLININYEYENGDIINLDYCFISPLSFNDIDQKEFEEYHLSLTRKQPNINIFQSKKLFQQKKGIYNEKIKDLINWDIETKDKILKCRVDNVNKYNVFLQSGFLFSSLDDVINVMVKCSELFYSNDYKIIGIENRNGGGFPLLYGLWHQLIQQKTLDRNNRALLNNEDIITFLKQNNILSQFSNIETCKFFSPDEDIGKITDDYGYSEEFEENIKHNRSKIYNFMDKTWRKRLQSIRKNNFENNNLKNPTDILIYTDSYCFSACSGLIKAFQNTGGAIIVGFNGNPNIKGTNEFDGSQSASSVAKYKTEENLELESLGYHIYGVTYSESFDESYKEPNPIPREYTVELVDRRVDIYGPYSDEIYSSFISKSKNIFEEFENKCNKDNKKLLLNDDNCQLKEHQKGGHPCKDDGTWDLDNCKAYYCDLGYYYDPIKDECILDICNNIENETDIYVDIEKYKETTEFLLEPNNELVFHLQNDSYYYFLESNVENLFMIFHDKQNNRNNMNLCLIDFKKENIFDYEINVNYYKTLKQNATVKLTIIEKTPNISIANNIFEGEFYISSYITKINQHQLIYSFQSKKELIIGAFSFNKDIKIYFSEYNFNIRPKEIINIDAKIFEEINKNIINIKGNKTSLFIYKFPNGLTSTIYLLLQPLNLEKNINVEKERFLYLTQQNLEYNLYFNSNSKNFAIRLDSQTLNAEIEFLDKNKTVLNQNNRYIYLNKNNKKISLRLKNENPALIEILYELNDLTILDNDKKNFNLNEGYYLLKYKNSDKIKSINTNIESFNNLTLIVFANIVKGNYIGLLPEEENLNCTSINSEFIVPNVKINEDETFDILFKIKNNATLILKIEKDDNDEPNGDGFPLWVLIIIIGALLIIIAIIIIIIIKKNKNNKDNNFANDKENSGLIDNDE